MKLKRLLVAVFCLGAPACLLVTSLDGLADGDGEDAGFVPDAKTDIAPALDAPATDAPAQEQNEGGTADAGYFCDRQHASTFCADFDRGLPVSFDWLPRKGPNDVIDLDSLAFEGPASVLFRRALDGCSALDLRREIPTVTSSIRIEMMMRPSHIDAGYTGGYFGTVLVKNSTGNGCNVTFDRDTERLGFKEEALDGGLGSYVNATRFPVINQWTKLTIQVTRTDAGAGLLNVTVADGPALTNHALSSCRFGEATLGIGAGCGAAGVEMRYDNVVVVAE